MKKYLFLILFLLLPSICFGALVEGTNCGFVLVAPTDDPIGAGVTLMDGRSAVGKFVAPSGATAITEIGWWCNTASEAANFEIGLYDHDDVNNEPENRLVANQTNAKGTTAGWKKATLNYNITAGTSYWIAAQLDNVATTTNIDVEVTAGARRNYLTGATTLPNPWGTSSGTAGDLIAIYAVYTTGAERRIYLIQ